MATAAQANTPHSNEELVAAYLRSQVQMGKYYFKSRFIAEDIELSPNEIGAVMAKLQDQSESLDIEPWSYTNGTTWQVTIRE